MLLTDTLDEYRTLLDRREEDPRAPEPVLRPPGFGVVQANEIHDRLEKAGGALIALDLQIDTSTATGRLLMNLIATVAQWERDTIGERTRSALRAKRARGEQVGRKRVISDVVRGRVHELRAQGFSYREIGEHLLAEGHRPPSGLHRWQISTIQRLLQQEVAQPRVPS
jgi:hypothetical protein